VVALLHDFAAFHHQDDVAVSHRGQPVGNHQAGSVRSDALRPKVPFFCGNRDVIFEQPADRQSIGKDGQPLFRTIPRRLTVGHFPFPANNQWLH